MVPAIAVRQEICLQCSRQCVLMATLEMVASAATRRRGGYGWCVLDDIQVFGMKARLDNNDNIPSGIKWAMMFSMNGKFTWNNLKLSGLSLAMFDYRRVVDFSNLLDCDH